MAQTDRKTDRRTMRIVDPESRFGENLRTMTTNLLTPPLPSLTTVKDSMDICFDTFPYKNGNQPSKKNH